MRLKMVRLENYAGIMNGMSLNVIEIDFTRCTHRMIVIKGDNGSGKSTLFNALTPVPDDSSCFIPGLSAKKIIEYYDNTGMVYHMEFIHDVKPNGDRIPTKGYIKKISNVAIEELNPSGNITACKDIIYSIFKLDPNFIALSQLSTDDRGLADKKPAERKKFVNSIISSVEVYNNIHKTLSKRSSIFKSMINSILAKIDTIGDKDTMTKLLSELESKIASIESDKMEAMSSIAYYQSAINLLDPDQKMQDEYNSLEIQIQSLESQIKLCEAQCKTGRVYNGKVYDSIQSVLDLLESNLSTTQNEISSLKDKIASLLDSKNQLAEDYQQKENKYNSLVSNQDFSQINSALNATKSSIEQCEAIFHEMGLEDGSILSKDEYVIGINTLKSIKESVDTFIANNDDIVIQAVMEAVDGKLDINTTIAALKASIEEQKANLASLNEKYLRYKTLNDMTSILSERPKACKIDTCPFIVEAVEAQKEVSSIPIQKLAEEINKTESALNGMIDNLNNYYYAIQAGYQDMNRIFRMIDNARSVLMKLPVKNILLDKVEFVRRIINRQNLIEIDILYNYLDKANVFEDYRYYKEMLVNIEAEYKLYMAKKDLIDSLQNDMDSISAKIKEKQAAIDENYIRMNECLVEEAALKSRIDKTNNALIYEKELQSNIEKRDKSIERYNELAKNMQTIASNLSKIEIIRSNMDRLNVDYPKLCQDRDTIKHKLSLLEEYNIELAQYQGSYDKIETIRYYCSPTTGIQTLFMELYMNKIIELANKLLALLFDGMFHLDQFVINENEFRIPCSGGNLPHDDISSMSSSQVACISMILSFALLYQSASNLNVLKLDEIDGALDSANRRNFIVMLEEMLTVLQCDQCIIISHNDELNLENCDVIVLKQSHIEPINGNIIWKY